MLCNTEINETYTTELIKCDVEDTGIVNKTEDSVAIFNDVKEKLENIVGVLSSEQKKIIIDILTTKDENTQDILTTKDENTQDILITTESNVQDILTVKETLLKKTMLQWNNIVKNDGITSNIESRETPIVDKRTRVMDTDETKNEHKISPEEIFKFKDARMDGFVDPHLVDDKFYDGFKLVMFPTSDVDEFDVKKYLFHNFPPTEYITSYVKFEDNDNFSVRIAFKGLDDISAIKNMVDKKLQTEQSFKINTSYVEETFRNFIAPMLIDNEYNVFGPKVFNDRISTYIFSKRNNDEYMLPSKAKLKKIFSDKQGENPYIFLNNIPDEVFNTIKGNKLHGYTFVKLNYATRGEGYTSIKVFKTTYKKK